MNRDKNIKWTDWTWNLLTGCSRRCNYCYAWRFAKRLKGRYGYPEDDPFQCVIHQDRMDEPSEVSRKFKSRNPNLPIGSAMIFTTSMGEVFDMDRLREDIDSLFEAIEKYPQHQFQILTRNPEIAKEWDIHDNVWLGVTVTEHQDLYRVIELLQIKAKIRFISFEPLHGQIDLKKGYYGKNWQLELKDFKGISWLIIGAETGNRKGKIVPKESWIQDIVDTVYGLSKNDMFIPLFMKDNLKPYYNLNKELWQMYPKMGVKC